LGTEKEIFKPNKDDDVKVPDSGTTYMPNETGRIVVQPYGYK